MGHCCASSLFSLMYSRVSRLFNASNSLWSFGLSAAQSLFNARTGAVQADRQTTAVALIQSLGGGWNVEAGVAP